jgi:biotin carboxyl carrier protein
MSATKSPPAAKFELDDAVYETGLTRKFAGRKAYVPHDPKKILCFIPGVIRKIYARPGQAIRRGERLLILEAMKMQNDISSPEDGIVKTVPVTTGQMVTKGRLLVELE